MLGIGFVRPSGLGCLWVAHVGVMRAAWVVQFGVMGTAWWLGIGAVTA